MLNKTVLQGRLVRDVELRKTNSDVSVASFTVAWSEKYKETETQCFLQCTAWRNTGEFVNKYFRKGQEIVVEGKLVTRKWVDKDGENRSTTELSVDQAHFCGPKHDGAVNSVLSESNQTEPGELKPLDDDGDLPF